MGAEISNTGVLRQWMDLFKIKSAGEKAFPDEMLVHGIQPVVNVGEGLLPSQDPGFDFFATAADAGLVGANVAPHIIVSEIPGSTPYRNTDGTRIFATTPIKLQTCAIRIDLDAAGATALNNKVLNIRFSLQLTNDASTYFTPLYLFRVYTISSSILSYLIPITGLAAVSLFPVCTWDRIIPQGWYFAANLSFYNDAITTWPANTVISSQCTFLTKQPNQRWPFG